MLFSPMRLIGIMNQCDVSLFSWKLCILHLWTFTCQTFTTNILSINVLYVYTSFIFFAALGKCEKQTMRHSDQKRLCTTWVAVNLLNSYCSDLIIFLSCYLKSTSRDRQRSVLPMKQTTTNVWKSFISWGNIAKKAL